MRTCLRLAAVLVLALTVPALAQPVRPRLVVVIAVDQMRGDYVVRYQHQWSGGLKRLVTEGAWFRQADYPYFSTVTCAGHASIATGAPPAVHGMVQNQWVDPGGTRLTRCTDDAGKPLVPYGRPIEGLGQSADRLATTTYADELRLQAPAAPRVVSISLKARSAITLGGHHPDAVIWQDEDTGEWTTSSAFATTPAPFFADYIAAHDIRREVGRTWQRALPADHYLYGVSSIPPRGVSERNRTFPHTVEGRADGLDKVFTDSWEASPFSDAYLAGLAAAALDGLKLGRGPGTDYLAVSFSALDKVGHDFGPESHEVQDVLVRLDRELATLLDKLDTDVGRGRYVLALSADHGVSPVPEHIKARGYDGGRISQPALAGAIDAALAAAIGPMTGRTIVNNADIYLPAGAYQTLSANPEAMARVLHVVRDTPGVMRAYTRDEIAAGAGSPDRMRRAAALSQFPGRSGDLFMMPKAYWTTSVDTTSHGTAHRYDTHVPVILFGAGITPGQYMQPVSPLDIAPTVAFLTGVLLPDATGRVLTEALAR
ncbi:MAG: alkaline phosphatase family protein [Vicinamibacterales bacterium]